ncbi:hypothetical protein D6O84_05375 [Escherichia coli]|nr:hypothetical protein [Escherichia coli]
MFIFIIQLYNHFPVSLRFSENWSFIRTQEYMYEDLQRPTLYCFIDGKRCLDKGEWERTY